MEWNKAKSVLLAVLLCANLFLAGNLALQIAQGRTQQRQAMDQALELLHQDLGDFDETMFRAADGRRHVLAFNRSPEKERAAALALLGADQRPLRHAGVNLGGKCAHAQLVSSIANGYGARGQGQQQVRVRRQMIDRFAPHIVEMAVRPFARPLD